MVIDHIGVVVPSLKEGIEQWKSLFGYTLNSDIVENSLQRVRVAFLAKPNSLTVKLVEPSSEDSPVTAFARRGGGLHHLCFRCESLDPCVSELKSKGARFIVPAQPGEAFANHPIAFFLAPQNLNVELIDTEEKLGWK
jgi:methylmalonyl-CoA/ethylmalonyl-CoA epimerase